MPVDLYTEVAYEYDFDSDELSHFAWAIGPSVASNAVTIDAGLGGSEYNTGIAWTPSRASFTTTEGSVGTLTADGDNRLGTTFVDFLFGIKIRLAESLLLAGAVSVPIIDEGLRPAVTGTVAFEAHL